MNNKPNISSEQSLFLAKQKHNKTIITICQWGIFILFLGIWEFCAQKEIINSFIFSSPSKIAQCFYDMLLNQELLSHIGITLFETLIGFVLVFVFSILLAVVLWWNEGISKIVEPYLVVLNSLPKSALAPVLIVWLGANTKTIIVCAMSVALFGSILNIYTGFVTVDSDKLKLIKTLKGTKKDCLRLVVIPSSIPNLLSVMKVNIGLCLVGVVIGEFLAARAGLGYLIIYGSQTFKLSWVMMAIGILCIIAMLLYFGLQKIEKRLSEYF